MSELRVIPVESAMVPDYEAMDGGVVRFIGRKFTPSAGGFVMSENPVTVPRRAEYIAELKAGCLLPADKATADAAGLAFKV